METEKKAGDDEQKICIRNNGRGWKCKNVSGDNILQYCERHYNYYFFSEKDYSYYSDLTKKMEEDEKKQKLAPDEKKIKKRSRDDDEGDDSKSDLEIRDSNCLKWPRKQQQTEDDDGQPSTNYTSCGSSTNVGTKRKKVETTPGELESLTEIREPLIGLECLVHYKIKCFKLSVELEKNKVELEKMKMELEKKKVELEKKNVEIEKAKMELEKNNVELEKKNVECTKLQGKYVEIQCRKTVAKDEDATKYWKNKCSDLESLVQRMEIENSTLRCEVSRVSNLGSLVLRNGNERSILRCEESCSSEKIETEARGLWNAEKQRHKYNMSKFNAETSCGGRKDSHVYEFKTKEKVLNAGNPYLSSKGENVEEGKGWGCSEERPSQHGSSSQDNLDMSMKPFANLISDDGGESLDDSEDSDSSDDSKDSLGHLMDMLAMKYRNKNDEKEMEWKSEPELLSSFEEDRELCMKAVCALYRQEITKDEISPKRLYYHSDTLRCTTLAKFLMEKDCKGDLKRSAKELEALDSEAVDDCKRLARRYSMQLFDIYQNGKDPFFCPPSTASHGD